MADPDLCAQKSPDLVPKHCDQDNVIYNKKLKRMAVKMRERKIEEKKGRVITGVMFDERKDTSRAEDNTTSKKENCTVIIFPGQNNISPEDSEVTTSENHEVSDETIEGNNLSSELPFRAQDQGEYLGHCTPLNSTGKGVAEEVLSHLDKYEADLDNLKTVMTDGTSKMTGHKSGSVTVLEQNIGRPLQRSACRLNHVEKPFEHLFTFHNGKTKDPKSFKGPIGKAI